MEYNNVKYKQRTIVFSIKELQINWKSEGLEASKISCTNFFGIFSFLFDGNWSQCCKMVELRQNFQSFVRNSAGNSSWTFALDLHTECINRMTYTMERSWVEWFVFRNLKDFLIFVANERLYRFFVSSSILSIANCANQQAL